MALAWLVIGQLAGLVFEAAWPRTCTYEARIDRYLERRGVIDAKRAPLSR
jgi:hypothetical protein